MLPKDIENIESEIKNLYDENLKKLLFKSTSCLEIIKIAKDLIKKASKKNKQFKELEYEEKLKLTKDISIYILEKSKNHNIIEEDKSEIIKDIIEKLYANRELFDFVESKCCKFC